MKAQVGRLRTRGEGGAETEATEESLKTRHPAATCYRRWRGLPFERVLRLNEFPR